MPKKVSAQNWRIAFSPPPPPPPAYSLVAHYLISEWKKKQKWCIKSRLVSFLNLNGWTRYKVQSSRVDSLQGAKFIPNPRNRNWGGFDTKCKVHICSNIQLFHGVCVWGGRCGIFISHHRKYKKASIYHT